MSDPAVIPRRVPLLVHQGLGRLLLPLSLAMVAAGCSAQADTEPMMRSSVDDAAGDVVVAGPNVGDGAIVAAPGDTSTDIINTTVDHREDAVTFQVAFRGLRPEQYLDVTANIRTSKTGSGGWQLTSVTYRGDDQIYLYGPRGSNCPAAAVEIDYSTNTVTMTVPRSCLDDPTWIQTKVNARTMKYDARPGDRHADSVWQDDAYQDGYTGSAHGSLGPKLHHP